MTDENDRAPERPTPGTRPGFPVSALPDRVQCPNCCRLARVTSRRMELVFYECDLCGSVGAAPE
jgi:rubredoxin